MAEVCVCIGYDGCDLIWYIFSLVLCWAIGVIVLVKVNPRLITMMFSVSLSTYLNGHIGCSPGWRFVSWVNVVVKQTGSYGLILVLFWLMCTRGF